MKSFGEILIFSSILINKSPSKLNSLMRQVIENQVLRVLLFFLLAVMVFSGFISGDRPSTDLEKLQLKGRVKSVTEIRLNNSVSGESISGTSSSYKKISKFNIDGYETEAVIYNNGKYSNIIDVFDTAGNKIGFREYKEDGTLWTTVTYNLDKKGNPVSADYDWLGKGEYDEIREKSELLYEVLDRNPWYKVLYKNDFRGFHTEEKYLGGDGKLLFKFSYRYDIHGNKVEMTYFNSRGRTSWDTKYHYDQNDILVESIVFKSNRVAAISKYTYQYDSKGNWVNRLENREVNYNILTASLVEGNFVIRREIEYY